MKSSRVFRYITAIILSICFIVSLTACNKDYIPTNVKTYQYNYYPGTDWGMTEQEVMKALDLKEKDISRLEKEEGSKVGYTSAFSIEKKIYGSPAIVEFCFNQIESPNKRINGLSTVVVHFKESGYAKEKREHLKSELKAQGDMFIEDANEKSFPDIIENSYTCKGLIKENENLSKVKVTDYTLLYGYGYTAKKNPEKWSLTNITITTEEPDKNCIIYYQGLYAAIQNSMDK